MKVKEYLAFTKRERSGIISIIILVMVVAIIPKLYNRPQPVTEEITFFEIKDTTKTKKVTSVKKFQQPKYVKKKIEPFDINEADTSAFIALPGIGSKLAARIVLFREKLGGFYDKEQIREVYGLHDSVFQKISPLLECNPQKVKKIDINSAEKETLKVHPYIRWKVANALVTYRAQHGSFSSAEDLSKLENVDEDALKKMMPYISFK